MEMNGPSRVRKSNPNPIVQIANCLFMSSNEISIKYAVSVVALYHCSSFLWNRLWFYAINYYSYVWHLYLFKSHFVVRSTVNGQK